MEKRASKRYEIQAPCQLRPETGFSRASQGFTINVSRSGVVLGLAEQPAPELLPKVGQQAVVDIELPRPADGVQNYLHCYGRIVRIEASNGAGPIVALHLEAMSFQRHAQTDQVRLELDRRAMNGMLGIKTAAAGQLSW